MSLQPKHKKHNQNTKQKLKVLLPLHRSPRQLGGLETHVDKIAHYLSRNHRNIDLKIIAFTNLSPETINNYQYSLQEIKSTYIIKDSYPFPLPWQLFRYIKAIIKYKPDIIHTHNRYVPSTWIGQIYSLIFNKKNIHTEHASTKNVFSNAILTKIAELLDKTLIALLLKTVTICTAVSQSAQQFMKQEFNMKKVQLIHNFIDPSELIRYQHKYKTLSNTQDTIKISFIARLIDTKGYKEFLALTNYFLTNKNLQFFIVGNGPGNAEINQFSANSLNTRYLGRLTHEDCIKHMLYTDIVVNCSTLEGLSTTLLEAIFLKKFIVAHQIQSNQELIGSYAKGLLYQNFQELTQKIILLTNNLEKYNLKTINTTQFKQYNLSESAEAYYSIYQTV